MTDTITTIQATSKRFKAQVALSAITFWIGLIAWFTSGPDLQPWVPVATIGGACWYVLTKIRVWWHHH